MGQGLTDRHSNVPYFRRGCMRNWQL